MEFDSQRTHLAYEQADVSGSSTANGAQPVRHCSAEVSPSLGLVVPVILSGGAGSRLWPYSTEELPKQFLPLAGPRSLFQQALDRVGDRLRFASPIVVGSARHARLCEQELAGDAGEARLILEPCARNTAGAIVMAAALAREIHGDDAVLLVMPSDHVIDDAAAFDGAVRTGEAAARRGRLVTFGIRPTAPETGYGYLEMGRDIAGSPGVREVTRFVEKPHLAAAQEMVEGGNHLWNAGIFLFRADAFLDEAMKLAPAIGGAAQAAIAAACHEGTSVRPDAELFASCPSESVDYAIMERSERVAVVPMSAGWSDVGSWDALAALVDMPAPIGPVTALDCADCYIRSDGIQVAALGIRDLIVVASGSRLLILPRGRSQEVKKLVSAMDPLAA